MEFDYMLARQQSAQIDEASIHYER
jgi:hypothetical protein